MSSVADICNMALSHLGIGIQISNLETDVGDEALACRRFYEVARDAVLRDFNWPFATRFKALGLVEEQPTNEWAYSYRYPTDCLRVRRILSGIRNDDRQSRIPYKIISDAGGSLIYTDMVTAQIEYTSKITDPQKFQPDFTLALSYRLAFYIVGRITGGDPFNLKQAMLQAYTGEMSAARATAFNEEQIEEDAESEYVRARL